MGMRGDISQRCRRRFRPRRSAAFRLISWQARKNLLPGGNLAAVPVSIYELTLESVEGDRARLRVRCSGQGPISVRRLRMILGMALGCGAHVEELGAHAASGSFRLGQAANAGEELQVLKGEDRAPLKADCRLREALLPMAELLPQFPGVTIDDLTARQIRQGRDFSVSAFRANPGSEFVKAVDSDGSLVAIGRIALPHVYHPVVVFSL